jgi:lantibiotic transport system permease protein
MVKIFINSFESEWLKRRRSAASWLTVVGALFIPLIILAGRMINFKTLYSSTISPGIWEKLFNWSWKPMSFFMLPLGVILATGLITQIEFKNNTWKQLHAGPQSLSIIFFTKLSVILVMLFQFFVLFNIGIYLEGALPALIFRGIPYPEDPIPFMDFFKLNIKCFICCLPIVALQYLVSLQFRNLLISLGIGLGMYVASMMANSWEHGYVMPYIYSALNYMGEGRGMNPPVSIYVFSLCYFFLFTILGYILYITKKDRS